MSQLPTALASRQRRSVIDDATTGLGSSRGAHLSIRGGRFRLVSATGVETPMEGHHIDVIVVDANDKPARVFFEGPYDPTQDIPPMCFSDNGTGPSSQAMSPQAPTCAVCSHNIRGSDTTFTGKPTTACDNRKKVAVIIPDDPAVNVYEFQIPPGSLSNLRAYGAWLGQQASGVQGRKMDIADVVTRISFDPDRQFVMQFQAVAFADDERTMQLIDYIDANKLSDAAVGRNDIACDPAAVTAMLAGAARPAALPAPAAQATPQGQQFQLPPRTNPPAVLPAPATTSQAAAPARGGRGRKQEPQTPPAGAGPAAPFMAPAANGGAPGQGQSAALTRPAGATVTAASPSDTSIPDFLRCTNEPPSAPAAPLRFGVGAAPTPPAAIQDALNAAMNLPTRR